MKNKLNPDIMLLIIAVIWGGGFIATNYAIKANMSALLILATRFALAAIVLFIFVYKGLKKTTKKEWLHGSIAGALLFTGFLLQTYGQGITSVSNSALLTATNVVFVPFISWILIRKKPANKVFILALMTFIGATILTVDFGHGFHIETGDFFILACAIVFAGYIAYLSVAAQDSDVLKLTFIQMAVATLLSMIGLLIFGRDDLSLIDYPFAIPSVLYLGLFSTCLCFFMQTSAQKRTTPSKAGIILSTESLFGTLFSIVLGIEILTPKIVFGGLIILTAVILTEVDFSQKKVKVTSEF